MQIDVKTESLDTIVARQAARSQKFCDLIQSKGGDLAEARSIDLHFWADGEIAAHRLATALRGRGWSQVRLNPTADEGVWNVEVEIEASVLEIIDLGFMEGLAQLAMDNRGEFDGWGTSI